MKKSKQVTLTLLTAAAAAAIAGCGPSREAQVQRCVDERNIMTDERNCEQPYAGGASGSYGTGSSGGFTPAFYAPRYRWVYGGNGGYLPGSVVYDASPFPDSALGTVRASQLAASGYNVGGGRVGMGSRGGFSAPSARGGFGSTGHAMSGGGHGAGE